MISFVLALALLIADSPESIADPMCSCVERSFEDELESADLIFEGVVLREVPYPENWHEASDADFQPVVGFGIQEYVFFFRR